MVSQYSTNLKAKQRERTEIVLRGAQTGAAVAAEGRPRPEGLVCKYSELGVSCF